MKVLLIGQYERGCSQLARQLEKNGCRWWFASKLEEMRGLLDQHQFQLVLSTRPVVSGSELMQLLEGRKSNVFYSYATEDSCLWFQAMNNGEPCSEPALLRPSELARAIEAMAQPVAKPA